MSDIVAPQAGCAGKIAQEGCRLAGCPAKPFDQSPERSLFCILGLGPVGLPIALGIGRHFQAMGFDADPNRVRDLQHALDRTGQVSTQALQEAVHLEFVSVLEEVARADIYVVAADMAQFDNTNSIVSLVLTPGNVVLYAPELPGSLIEREAVRQVETAAEMLCNRDFYIAYFASARCNSGKDVGPCRRRIKGVRGTPKPVTRYLARLQKSVQALQAAAIESCPLQEK